MGYAEMVIGEWAKWTVGKNKIIGNRVTYWKFQDMVHKIATIRLAIMCTMS